MKIITAAKWQASILRIIVNISGRQSISLLARHAQRLRATAGAASKGAHDAAQRKATVGDAGKSTTMRKTDALALPVGSATRYSPYRLKQTSI